MGWGPFPSPGEVVEAVSDTVDVVSDVHEGIVSLGADALEAAGNAALGMAETAFNGLRAASEWVGDNIDLLTLVINPFAYLTGEVAGYIINNIGWLKDPIDLMQGDGGAVTELAEEWKSISEALSRTSQLATQGAESSSAVWQGDAGETYRSRRPSARRSRPRRASLRLRATGSTTSAASWPRPAATSSSSSSTA